MIPGQPYQTSNQDIAWPFADDSAGIVYPGTAHSHGASATIPAAFLADACVVAESGYQNLYLASISAVVGGWELTIRSGPESDPESVPVFVFTYEPSASAVVSAESGTNSLRLLKGRAFDSYLLGVTGTNVYGDGLELAPGVVETRPPKLDTISILKRDGTVIPGIARDVNVISGYNIEFGAFLKSGDVTSMSLSAVPGTGDGRIPCEPQVVRKRVMPLRPNTYGAVSIRSDDCYAIDVVDDGNGSPEIRIQGLCHACCSCDDYLGVANALAALIQRAQAVKTSLFDTYAAYEVDAGNYGVLYP